MGNDVAESWNVVYVAEDFPALYENVPLRFAALQKHCLGGSNTADNSHCQIIGNFHCDYMVTTHLAKNDT